MKRALSVILISISLGNLVWAAPTPNVSQQPYENTHSFEQGEISLQICSLQERLHSLGYFNMHVTGVFGTFTEDAVKLFQKSNKLTEDGDTSQDTINLVYSNTALPYTKGIPEPSTIAVELPDNTIAMRANDAMDSIAIGQVISANDLYTNTTLTLERQPDTQQIKMTCTSEDDVATAKNHMSYPWQKRPVIINLDGKPVLACLEYPRIKTFEITDTFTLFFYDSKSSIGDFPDDAANTIIHNLIDDTSAAIPTIDPDAPVLIDQR